MPRRGFVLLVLVCVLGSGLAGLVGPAPAAGQDLPPEADTGYLPYDEPHPLQGASVWGALARSVFALGVVLALMGGTVVVLRRFLPGVVGGPGAGPVRLVGRVTLAPKQAVYFLQVPGRILVVGSGGGQLSALGEIADPDEVAEILQAAPGLTAAPAAAFGGLLHRRLQRAGAMVPKAAAGPEDVALDAIRRQIARLRSLASPEAR